MNAGAMDKLILILGWAAIVISIAIQTIGSISMLGQAWPWIFISAAVGCAAWLRNTALAWGVVVAILWPLMVLLMFVLFFNAP
ncbi:MULTISPECIES: hypothetical protein [Corynebacterium]|uniref:hypothetical protein n=2 Tax=Corynebacteriaceae TaxID=1653 RepID=UPI00124D87C6|nr:MULTISPECIES: hypothetical protein [Corynebacterium]